MPLSNELLFITQILFIVQSYVCHMSFGKIFSPQSLVYSNRTKILNLAEVIQQKQQSVLWHPEA